MEKASRLDPLLLPMYSGGARGETTSMRCHSTEHYISITSDCSAASHNESKSILRKASSVAMQGILRNTCLPTLSTCRLSFSFLI